MFDYLYARACQDFCVFLSGFITEQAGIFIITDSGEPHICFH